MQSLAGSSPVTIQGPKGLKVSQFPVLLDEAMTHLRPELEAATTS